MQTKLTEEEIEFCEALYDPKAMSECLFSDIDNLCIWDDRNIKIRTYQLPLLSSEYLIADDPKISKQENFNLRIGTGTLFALGGRKFGKSKMLMLDLLLSLIHHSGKLIMSSFDGIHVKDIMDPICDVVNTHPFFRIYNPHITRTPNFLIKMRTGCSLESVNMNLGSKNPGAAFERIHADKIFIDEAEYENEIVSKKRHDSTSELGIIERIYGITSFTKHSPCGKTFFNRENKNYLVNLPQFVSPFWNERAKNAAILKHGGRNAISFLVNVCGEVVEGVSGLYDIDRIRRNYNDEKIIKNFEITKNSLSEFKNIIILDRPVNVDRCFICGDVGDMASPSEIVVIFEIKKKYKYVYNITLYKLTGSEEIRIYKYLIQELGAEAIGLDCTDGKGREMFRDLIEICPKENLTYCHFAQKMAVDFEKDDDGNLIIKDGEPVYRNEYVIDWSVLRLKYLLYNELIEIPQDMKFDIQFNSMVIMQSRTRTTYDSTTEDHLHAAFQVFAITQWEKEFLAIKPIDLSPQSPVGEVGML